MNSMGRFLLSTLLFTGLVSSAMAEQCVFNVAELQPSSKHYLSDVIRYNKRVRFDPAKMPIRVYLQDGRNVPGWNSDHVRAVTEAMTTWESVMQGKVRFVRTQNPAQADIRLHWEKSMPERSGYTHSNRNGCYVKNTEITLSLSSARSGKYYKYDRLKAVAIHEFGHALGFKGHSSSTSDLMSSSGSHPTSLSQRDINTMRMIYAD